MLAFAAVGAAAAAGADVGAGAAATGVGAAGAGPLQAASRRLRQALRPMDGINRFKVQLLVPP